MNKLLTPREVAERLSVSTRTVYVWIEQGRLPVIRLSERVTRIPEDAVDALVAQGATPPAAPGEVGCGEELAAETPAVYATRSASEHRWSLLEEHRDEIIRIVREGRADNTRVFGSMARGDAGDVSDVDLLIDPQPGMTLFDLGGIRWRLEELLGVKVDVVPARSLREPIRDRVLAEARPL